MKKPAPGSSQASWLMYQEWVRSRLENWDPADDHSSPTVYIPRNNGIRALEVENVEYDRDEPAE